MLGHLSKAQDVVRFCYRPPGRRMQRYLHLTRPAADPLTPSLYTAFVGRRLGSLALGHRIRTHHHRIWVGISTYPTEEKNGLAEYWLAL